MSGGETTTIDLEAVIQSARDLENGEHIPSHPERAIRRAYEFAEALTAIADQRDKWIAAHEMLTREHTKVVAERDRWSAVLEQWQCEDYLGHLSDLSQIEDAPIALKEAMHELIMRINGVVGEQPFPATDRWSVVLEKWRAGDFIGLLEHLPDAEPAWAICEESESACRWSGEQAQLRCDSFGVNHCPACGSTAISELDAVPDLAGLFHAINDVVEGNDAR